MEHARDWPEAFRPRVLVNRGRQQVIASTSPTRQALSTTDVASSLPAFFSALTAQHPEIASASSAELANILCLAIEELYQEIPVVPSFVVREVARIRAGAPFILIAHQPVLFPYEAVVLNYTLLHSMVEMMQSTSPCIVHLVMDTDGADERAFHRVKYPALSTRQGFLTLRADVGAHWTGWTCNALPAPRPETLEGILDDIAVTTKREWRMADGRPFGPEILEQIRGAFQRASANAPLLTTFMINVLAEYAWLFLRIPIIFVRYSAILRFSSQAIADLVAERQVYHGQFCAAEDSLGHAGKLVPESPDQLFWTHCSRCWTRRMFTDDAYREHECAYHAQSHQFHRVDSSNLSISTVPKVLMEDIFIRTYLRPLAIVNYRGGRTHAAVAIKTLNAMGKPQPPTLTWGSGWLSDGPVEKLHERGGMAPGANNAFDLVHSGRASMLYAWLHGDADAKRQRVRGVLDSVERDPFTTPCGRERSLTD